MFADEVLSRVLLREGFIHIGKPLDWNYDPVCFDTRARSRRGEYPLVRLDHEEILIGERVKVREKVAESFLDVMRARRSRWRLPPARRSIR